MFYRNELREKLEAMKIKCDLLENNLKATSKTGYVGTG